MIKNTTTQQESNMKYTYSIKFTRSHGLDLYRSFLLLDGKVIAESQHWSEGHAVSWAHKEFNKRKIN